MGGRPGFEDDKDSDAEDKAKEIANNTVCYGPCRVLAVDALVGLWHGGYLGVCVGTFSLPQNI